MVSDFKRSRAPGIAARLQCPNRASISMHLIDDSGLTHDAKNHPRMNQIKEKGPHTNSHLEWSPQWAREQYLLLRYCDPDPSSNRVRGIVNHSCGIVKIDQGLCYCLKGTRLYRSHDVSRHVKMSKSYMTLLGFFQHLSSFLEKEMNFSAFLQGLDKELATKEAVHCPGSTF